MKNKFSIAPDHRFQGGPSVEFCLLCKKLRAVHEDDGFVPNREMTNIERQFWSEKRDYFRMPGSEPKQP